MHITRAIAADRDRNSRRGATRKRRAPGAGRIGAAGGAAAPIFSGNFFLRSAFCETTAFPWYLTLVPSKMAHSN
jgi:hypothetical protein